MIIKKKLLVHMVVKCINLLIKIAGLPDPTSPDITSLKILFMERKMHELKKKFETKNGNKIMLVMATNDFLNC